MTKIERTMNETMPFLSPFDMFNLQNYDMSYSTRKQYEIIICAQYRNLLSSTFHGNSSTTLPIINEANLIGFWNHPTIPKSLHKKERKKPLLKNLWKTCCKMKVPTHYQPHLMMFTNQWEKMKVNNSIKTYLSSSKSTC